MRASISNHDMILFCSFIHAFFSSQPFCKTIERVILLLVDALLLVCRSCTSNPDHGCVHVSAFYDMIYHALSIYVVYHEIVGIFEGGLLETMV